MVANTTACYYLRVPDGAVDGRRVLEALRDTLCVELGLPIVEIRYFRKASGLYERGLAALGQLGLEIKAPGDTIDGLVHPREIAGLTLTAYPREVWLSIDDAVDTRTRLFALAHELQHRWQIRAIHERGTDAQAIARAIVPYSKARLQAWAESDADRYAASVMARIDRGELRP